MFSWRFALATDEIFQLVDVAAPFESVEELEAAELRFVKGAFAVARAEIEIIVTTLREMLHRRGHQEQAETLFEPGEIVEGVIVEGDAWMFQIEHNVANFLLRLRFREDHDV